MNYSILSIIISLLLNSCTSSPIIFNRDTLYRQKAELRLKVKTVDVVNSYVAPEKTPYIDHLLPYSLAEFLTEWAHHRLVPSSSRGFAVVTIENASVTQWALPVKKGLMETFTRLPSHRFEANASVRIDFMDYRGYPQGYATAQTKQLMTMLEKTSPAEQQTLVQNLCKTVTDAIDQEIEKSLRKHATTVLLS